MSQSEQAASNGQASAGDKSDSSSPLTLKEASNADSISDTASAEGAAFIGKEPASAEASADAATAKPPAARIEDHFKRLGGLRDGMLVFGGAVYVAGRVLWACYTQRFNLGIVPAEQSQYFVAGFVPTLIAGLAWFGTLGIKSSLESVGKFYRVDVSRRRRIVQKLFSASYAVASMIFLILWLGEYFWTGRHYVSRSSLPYALSLLAVTGVFTAGLPLFMRVRSNEATEKMQFDRFEWTLTALYPILVGILLVSVYGGFVYPILPQEYGGARPRMAYLDLDRSKLSVDTLGYLLPPKEVQAKSPTVRTVLLDVFFASKDTLLVKPRLNHHNNRTYEIPGGSVLGRTWVDPADLRP